MSDDEEEELDDDKPETPQPVVANRRGYDWARGALDAVSVLWGIGA